MKRSAFLSAIMLIAVTLLGANMTTSNVHAAPTDLFGFNDHQLFLPLVLSNYEPGLDWLISPQNGAVLDTLVPLFEWETGSQPGYMTVCFAIDISPHPTGCSMWSGLFPGRATERLLYNFDPDTIYYWRVGVSTGYSSPPDKWSYERSFTSGPIGGEIPPSPALSSPANGSSVSTPLVRLSWQPVSGAEDYSIFIRDPSLGGWWYGYTGLITPYFDANIPDLQKYAGFGNNLEWNVIARNSYAYSSYSELWQFTYTGPAGSPQGSAIADEELLLLQGDSRMFMTR